MSGPPHRVARDVVVRGQVQGVGFRESCRRAAVQVGVDGWVRNAPDGTVHARIEGAPDAVERLVSWLRRGPSHATVEAAEVDEADPEGASGFRVR